jgi:hypothetical protein
MGEEKDIATFPFCEFLNSINSGSDKNSGSDLCVRDSSGYQPVINACAV